MFIISFDYTCMCCRTLSKKSVIWRCLIDINWSAVDISICLHLSEWHICIFCSILIVVSTLRVSTTKNGQVQTESKTGKLTAFYTCNKGFVKVGEENIVCLSSGKWKKATIKCGRYTTTDLFYGLNNFFSLTTVLYSKKRSTTVSVPLSLGPLNCAVEPPM